MRRLDDNHDVMLDKLDKGDITKYFVVLWEYKYDYEDFLHNITLSMRRSQSVVTMRGLIDSTG